MIRDYLLQIILITAGFLLFLYTIYSLAKKSITEPISMFWSMCAVLFVIAGILLIPLKWEQYITLGALVIITAGYCLVFAGMFYFSIQLSRVIRKTQELAMQVSLLNQEHTAIDKHLSELSGLSPKQIWRTNTAAEESEERCEKGEMSLEESPVCN